MNIKARNYNFTYIGFENKIDLTEYKKICAVVSTGEYTQDSGNYIGITLGSSQLPSVLDIPEKHSDLIYNNENLRVISYFIPDECKNSNYYIGLFAAVKDAYVYKIWLEK